MSLDSFEQSLLESGRRDAPSPERRRGARAAALRAATAMTAGPSSASTGALRSHMRLANATGAKALQISKVLLIVALGSGITLALFLGSRGEAPAVLQAVVSSAPAPTKPAPVPRPEPQASVPVVAVSALPSARIATRAPARTAAPRSVATPVTEDPVAVEARLLDTARRCLVAGDPSCARSHLAEYEARFMKGALAEEAALLAIDIARTIGDHEEARRRARALLAEHPRGVRSSWVRKVAEEGPAVSNPGR